MTSLSKVTRPRPTEAAATSATAPQRITHRRQYAHTTMD